MFRWKFSLLFFGILTLGGTVGAQNTRTSGSQIFHDDQISWGNWDPVKYLEAGWTGYHIVADNIKERNYLKYDCGDKCTRLYGPFCPDGDCKYKDDATIYAIVPNSTRTGYQQTVLGKAKAYDGGSVEETDLMLPNGISLAKIHESEAQSRVGMEESQISVFYAFDRAGQARQLGHMEEADAPGIYNQTESVYDDQDGPPRFLTTVVEKIFWNSDNGTEGFRVGTLWCNNDRFRLSEGLMKHLYNDKFDFSECTQARMPLASRTKSWMKASFTGRFDSDNKINNPENDRETFEYSVKAGWTWFNGTLYGIDLPSFRAVNLDTDEYTTMGKPTPNLHYGPSAKNSPKAKFIEMNFSREPSVKWANGSKDYLKSTKAVAMIVYDKHGELYTRLDGHHCDRSDGWGGDYVDGALQNETGLRNGLVQDIGSALKSVRAARVAGHATGSQAEELGYSQRYLRSAGLNELQWVTCNRARHATIHTYILFPPKLPNGMTSLYQKRQLLDAILAAMPDQSQVSTELSSAEDGLDKIRVLEKVTANGNDPSVVSLEDLVDINTEEDHLTAQGKVFELLGLVNHVPKSPSMRSFLTEPEAAKPMTPNTPAQRRKKTDDDNY